MADKDAVYVIPDIDEHVLESLRKDLDQRKKSPDEDETAAAAATHPTGLRIQVTATARRTAPARALAASSLSLFVCGAGQFLNRQFKLGAALFLMEAFALAAHWAMMRTWSTLVQVAAFFHLEERSVLMAVALADLLFIPLVLVSVAQAYGRAEAQEGAFQGFRSSILSGVASLLAPGWGQLVNAQIGKALFFLSGPLVGLYVAAWSTLRPLNGLIGSVDPGSALAARIQIAQIGLLGGAALLWVLSVYDAVLVAGLRRREA